MDYVNSIGRSGPLYSLPASTLRGPADPHGDTLRPASLSWRRHLLKSRYLLPCRPVRSCQPVPNCPTCGTLFARISPDRVSDPRKSLAVWISVAGVDSFFFPVGHLNFFYCHSLVENSLLTILFNRRAVSVPALRPVQVNAITVILIVTWLPGCGDRKPEAGNLFNCLIPGADALRGLAEPDPRRRCPRGGTCQSVSSRARPPGSPPTPRSLPPYSGNRWGGGGSSGREAERV